MHHLSSSETSAKCSIGLLVSGKKKMFQSYKSVQKLPPRIRKSVLVSCAMAVVHFFLLEVSNLNSLSVLFTNSS